MDLLEISDNKNRHPWEIARKKVVSQFISKIQKNDMNLLDVGSGDAYLADSLTKTFVGSHIYCVDTEYTPDLINKIENNFKNTKLHLHSSLNDVEIDTIDIVTLLDVIEHVPDDVSFLNDIINRSYIGNDTYFVITVPAYQILFSEHDVLLKHYRRYNLKQLKKTIDKSNLMYIEGGYFFTTLLFPRSLQVLREKLQPENNNNHNNLGTWKGGKSFTNLIENILLVDFRVLQMFKFFGINVPGLSCYIICKIK